MTTQPSTRRKAAPTAVTPGTRLPYEPLIGRIPVFDVTPVVGGGRWPARAIVGETLPVTATVFREGHDHVGASVTATSPSGVVTTTTMTALPLGEGARETDGFSGALTLDELGTWSFAVEAWADRIDTWHHNVTVKAAAGQDIANELAEGSALFDRAASEAVKTDAPALKTVGKALRSKTLSPQAKIAAASDPAVSAALAENPVRDLISPSPSYQIRVERERATFANWYELFPRSEGSALDPLRSGTFAEAAKRLPSIAGMGFDIVYLPPIHPIGVTERKGPNNSLTPAAGDPGSPWAIGGTEGGHDAIHPDLGTFADFDAFVAAAAENGLEVALDFALQCSPDHPWVTEHPEFFTKRPDGTIAYAENPPKKYQDIYPLDFDSGGEALRLEIRRVIQVWLDHGIRVFRVDNPHTKPVAFWEWLMADVRVDYPDVIWLAEAFTRPPMMHALAIAGFTQSYSYFTWRTGKTELGEYFTELSTSPSADYLRASLWPNTPDILHAFLQYGGPPAFKIRAVLAATGSPSWGIYSGFELFEHVAVRSGSEEYLDSEKYQFRPRDYAAAEAAGQSLAPYLRSLNEVRREHPALQRVRGLVVHATDGEEILAYSRQVGSDTILTVVNLDPHSVRETMVHLDLDALGFGAVGQVLVHDQLGNRDTYSWGSDNYVRLDPFWEPAHVFVVTGPDGTGPDAVVEPTP